MSKWVIIHFLNNIIGMVKSFVAAMPLAILAGIVCIYVLKRKGTKEKSKAIVLLVMYVAIMIQMAVLFRTFGSIFEIDLIPFNTPGGFRYIVLYGLANIFVFLPVGILPPMIWDKMNSDKLILLVGFCGSLFIELAQLILQCGICQTEDLIMNTIGAGMGYWIYKKGQKKWKKVE